MPVRKLSQDFARRCDKPGTYWDREFKGFGLLVRPTGTKSWLLQKSGRKRWTIGRYPEVDYAEARQRVLEQVQSPRISLTLRQALRDHVTRMQRKGTSASVPLMVDEVERYLGPVWLDMELQNITRVMCRHRHEELTRKVSVHVADRTMRHLRAVWNTASKLVDLPVNPTIAVFWHGVQRRNYPRIDLDQWSKSVRSLPNATHRDWNWFVLSTGLRKTSACDIQWQHIEDDVLLIPRPKGGEARAFRLPLSTQQIDLLNSRPRCCRWVFPNVHGSGRIREPVPRYMPNAHHLRAEFANICRSLRVPTYELKLLLNHATPSNITDDYAQNPDIEILRPHMQCVSDFVWKYF